MSTIYSRDAWLRFTPCYIEIYVIIIITIKKKGSSAEDTSALAFFPWTKLQKIYKFLVQITIVSLVLQRITTLYCCANACASVPSPPPSGLYKMKNVAVTDIQCQHAIVPNIFHRASPVLLL